MELQPYSCSAEDLLGDLSAGKLAMAKVYILLQNVRALCHVKWTRAVSKNQ